MGQMRDRADYSSSCRCEPNEHASSYAARGGKDRRTAAQKRASYLKGEATRKRNLAVKYTAWITAHPAEHGWLIAASGRARPFQFAVSLLDALGEYGSLTVGQLEAVRKFMAEDMRPRPVESVSAVGQGLSALQACFDRAAQTLLKNPALEIGHPSGEFIRFTRAKDSSSNPGAIYVNIDRAYAGKVLRDGSFIRVSSCNDAQRERILAVLCDPLAAAVESGHRTGRCAVSRHRLDNPESLARGIGPICAERFFGA